MLPEIQMEDSPMDELKRAYRTAVLIGISMIVSLFFYAYIVERITPGHSLLGAELAILRYVLYGISIAQFFFIKAIRNKVLSTKKQIGLQRSDQGKAFSPNIQKLLYATIVTYAFCESSALYGLVLFFIGKDKFDFYVLSAISLISFAIYFPRYHQWEEWMKTANGQV